MVLRTAGNLSFWSQGPSLLGYLPKPTLGKVGEVEEGP